MTFLKFFQFGSTSCNSFCTTQRLLAKSTNASLEKLSIPSKPKRPLSPYIKFLQIARPRIIESNPNVPNAQIVSLMAKEWPTYDPEKKKSWQDQYVNEMQIYVANMEEYKKSLTPEMKELMENIKKKKREASEKAKLKEKRKNLGMPQKPLSAYSMFLQQKFPELKKENPDMKVTELFKEVTALWKNVDPTLKIELEEKANNLKENYKKSMTSWQADMIKLGNTDVILKKVNLEEKPKKKK